MSLTIHPIKPNDFEPLRVAAAEDRHAVLWPTNVVKRDGEIVGYIGARSMPISHVWMNSRSVSAIESVKALRAFEDVLRCSGQTELVMPCDIDSPYYPFMRKLGFAPINEKTHIFHKLL